MRCQCGLHRKEWDCTDGGGGNQCRQQRYLISLFLTQCNDFKGENTIIVTLGANMELSVDRVTQLEAVIAQASIVLCQFEVAEETNYAAFEIARKHNVTTFYNAAPGKPGMSKDILKITDILCTNENEVCRFAGSKERFK